MIPENSKAPSRVVPELSSEDDLKHFFSHVPTFSSTIFAIMSFCKEPRGTDEGQAGRSGGALEVDPGVETGAEGDENPPVGGDEHSDYLAYTRCALHRWWDEGGFRHVFETSI